MKGSIKQRSKGSWWLRWYVRDESGKRVPRSETVRGTRREAEARLSQILHELNTGIQANPGRLTLSQYLDRWVTEYAESHWSASTLRPCKSHIRNHLKPALGSIPLAKLTPLHVQSYYTKKRREGKLSEQTLLHHHRYLHQALEQGVKWRIVPRNVMDGVTAPRPRPEEPAAFTREQVSDLLREAEGTPLFLPVLLAVTTGMRRGEVVGLMWQDVDLKAGKLSVKRSRMENGELKRPKSGKSRNIALPSLVVDALTRAKAEAVGEFVVEGKNGHPLRCDTITREFSRLAKGLKLPTPRFHTLRHSHASQLIALGVDIRTVSERLGHAEVATTLNVYAHAMPGTQERAALLVDEMYRQGEEA